MKYAPILKWKAGEKKAISNLSTEHTERILPIFEIVDDFESSTLTDDIKTYWSNHFYFDTTYMDTDECCSLLELTEYFKNENISQTPVLSPFVSSDVIKQISEHTEKVAFRVHLPIDFDSPEFDEILDDLINNCNKNNLKFDLILDFGLVENQRDANVCYRDMKDILSLDKLNDKCIEQLILSITSFPDSLSNMDSANELRCERFEYKLWKKICSITTLNIIYSDYGVSKFTDSEIDFKKLKYGVLPKAKYTTFDDYWIIKGARDKVSREMKKGFIEIAKQIIASDDYFGEDFSYGDRDISDRANGLNGKKTGNSTNWVTIGASHHLVVILEQLSS